MNAIKFRIKDQVVNQNPSLFFFILKVDERENKSKSSRITPFSLETICE